MNDDERWELHERLADALSADPARADALGAELGLGADELEDVARALSALGAATALDDVPVALQAGTRIGDYEVLEAIGRGGFGEVYRVRDPLLDVDVALKLIQVPPSVALEVQERFTREARAVARLDHPHVVRVRTAGWDRRGPYLVMDFVPGESLQRRIAREGPLPVGEAVELARQLADALAHAHAQGVLHRDVKPDNVLVADGVARLTDFGLARDTLARADSQVSQAGHALGTPGYWPPEQARGELEAIGPASDVYGLGATLYACLTGRAPYTGVHTLAILEAMARRAPIPRPSTLRDDVGPTLDALCARCLAFEPEARFPSAAAVRDALAAWGPGVRDPRRRSAVAALALTAALLLAAGAVWLGPRLAPVRVAAAPSTPTTAALASAGPRSAAEVASSSTEPPADLGPPPSDGPAPADVERLLSTVEVEPAAPDDPAPAPAPAPWWRRGPRWRATQADAPPASQEGTLIADPDAGQVLLFSGTGKKAVRSELWSWNGVAWRPLPVDGERPSLRAEAAGVFDLRRGHVVILGGHQRTAVCEDLWAYDGARWTRSATPLPATTKRPIAAYDAGREVLVALLGRELWEWDGARWSRKPSPPVLGRHLLYLERTRRVVLLGQDGRLWDYDGEGWNGASAPLPVDGARSEFAVSAGADAVLALVAPRTAGKLPETFETWLYVRGAWRRLDAGEPGEPLVFGLAWNPGRGRALVVAGPRKRREPALTRVLGVR
ncbi:MAG: serine/threonine-protein kinase [Planctomycetota bacterium]